MTSQSVFKLSVRVYFEGTDAGGVVYHANYLAFMERARTAWLNTLGFSNKDLQDKQQLAFAVKHVELDYRAPARLEDELMITARLSQVKRTSLIFEQKVNKDEIVLCRGQIVLVCIDLVEFRPCPIPETIVEAICKQNLTSCD